MKDFFLNLLQNLDKLTGIQQYHKLMQLPNWKTEINALLDILVGVCRQFPYIPEDAQKSLIRHAVVTDADFIGLNAKCVYKYLSAAKDRYFKELAHQDAEPEHEPVTGEARDEWLRKYQEAVDNCAGNMTAPVKKQTVRERLNMQDAPRTEPRPSTGPEVANEIDLKIQYGREHTDKSTGKPLEGHPSFEEWVKSLNPVNYPNAEGETNVDADSLERQAFVEVAE